jgi:hypothetical protein
LDVLETGETKMKKTKFGVIIRNQGFIPDPSKDAESRLPEKTRKPGQDVRVKERKIHGKVTVRHLGDIEFDYSTTTKSPISTPKRKEILK